MENSTKPKGGAREGAGRKPKHEEDKIKAIATAAIVGKYGSMEDGFKALLTSGEPALIKFVYEHAAGKPKENVNVSGGVVFKLKRPGQPEEDGDSD